MRVSILVPIFCMAVLLLKPCSAEQKYHFDAPYYKKPLSPVSFDKPISCTAEWKVNGGYQTLGPGIRPVPGGFDQQYVLIGVFNLDTPTLWRIVVHGDTADVTSAGGDYKTIETDVWRVVSKSVSALVLSFDKPQSFISTITIDAESGTFIHVFSGRVLDSNEVTVYLGSCSNQ